MTRLYWLPTTALLLTLAAMAGAHLRHQETMEEHHRAVLAENAKPKMYDLLLAQAKALLGKKEIDKAIPLLQQVLVLEPNYIDANGLLADIYLQRNRPKEALQALRPIVYPKDSVGENLILEMRYVLALLDTDRWEEAATLYTKSVREPLTWSIPNYSAAKGSPEFILPHPHFTPGYADMLGLRAQVHLILGTRQPQFDLASLDEKDQLPYKLPYMLDHLQQALKSDRNSLDAQFLIAVALGSMKRYDEARRAFAVVTKNAPRELRPQIKVAQASFDLLEENEKNFYAQQAKRLAEQKAHAQGNVAP